MGKRPAEKRVLAQQAVSKGGNARASAPSKSDGGGYFRDIVAVFTFMAAIGVSCALFTYRRADGVEGAFQNVIGPVGHAVGRKLFGVFGVCGYLVPVAMFYASVALFVRGKGKHRGRQMVGVVWLALSGATLAHLLLGTDPSWNYAPGGGIGAVIGESLRALFSTFGSVLLMTAVAFGALIIATDAAFARLCVAVGGWTGNKVMALGAWTLAEGKRQYAAMVERRELRAKERAEEEAALAQALADAEEAEDFAQGIAADEVAEHARVAAKVVETEDDAMDADAIAEEAARLARDAEDRRARDEAEARAREVALRAAKSVRKPEQDPAWVLPTRPAAAPPDKVAANAVVSQPPAPVEAKPAEKPRQMPVLALPPSVQAAQPAVAEPAAGAALASAAAVAGPVVAAAAMAPATAIAVPPPPNPAPAGPASMGAPQLPVIVEPKAPPKPVKPRDEKKDPFAFEGDTKFSLPPLSLLEMTEEQKKKTLDKEVFFATAEKLREKLASFGIDGQVKEIRPGPVVTMYEFEPAPGIKISKIASLSDDLAMAMEALKVRIIAPIPGKGVVGIEVPNKERETVYLKEIVEQDMFLKAQSKLALAIGKNIEGMPYVTDLAKMPHVLIAGTTGSGKSVSVNAMIMSMLLKATPEEVRFIMVDPKVTELSIYEGIPHLLLPVVTDPRKAALALRWGVEEMERRYQMLADAGVRNIAGYNKWVDRQGEGASPDKDADALAAKPIEKTTSTGKKITIIDVGEGESEEDAIARVKGDGDAELGVAAPKLDDDEPAKVELTPEELAEERREELAAQAEEGASPEAEQPKEKEKPKRLPYIVIIIDEVADLMMVASKEVETYVARLAQMARAAGIHLMIATQRPSTDVITGVIKANFPSRISFMLRSKPDSMTILGTIGAEALLGMGDMLILPPTSAHLERVHGAFVSDGEIQKVVAHLKAQGKPVYDESILRPRDEEGAGEDGGGGEEEFADEAYDQCLAIVSEMRQVSVSMLQRKLRLGYNRAARIIERMEREGIVGPANGSKPREVLIRPVGETHKEVNL